MIFVFRCLPWQQRGVGSLLPMGKVLLNLLLAFDEVLQVCRRLPKELLPIRLAQIQVVLSVVVLVEVGTTNKQNLPRL